jgi:hypothetical protein
VDAPHNDAMRPAELDALELAGAQELVDRRSADIEHFGSAIDGDGQAVVESDLCVTTFAHEAKIGAPDRGISTHRQTGAMISVR